MTGTSANEKQVRRIRKRRIPHVQSLAQRKRGARGRPIGHVPLLESESLRAELRALFQCTCDNAASREFEQERLVVDWWTLSPPFLSDDSEESRRV